MRRLFCFILGLFFFTPTISFARPRISGEMEWQFDGDGGRGFSQYLYLNTGQINFTARYFWVENVLEQGEFALGPTVHVGDFTIKVWAGATTEKSVMLGGTLASKILGRDILYVLDPKIATTNLPDEIYQEAFIALDKNGSWQFQIESLQVAGNAVFVKTGVEYRLSLPWISDTHHIFLYPNFDAVGDTVGLLVGFRFFDW